MLSEGDHYLCTALDEVRNKFHGNALDILMDLGLWKACLDSGGCPEPFRWTHPDFPNSGFAIKHFDVHILTDSEKLEALRYREWKIKLIDMAIGEME